MVRYTLKILQHFLHDFLSVFDHFRKLCMKGSIPDYESWINKSLLRHIFYITFFTFFTIHFSLWHINKKVLLYQTIHDNLDTIDYPHYFMLKTRLFQKGNKQN